MDKPTENVEVSRRYKKFRAAGDRAIEALRVAKQGFANEVAIRLRGIDVSLIPDFDECYSIPAKFIAAGYEFSVRLEHDNDTHITEWEGKLVATSDYNRKHHGSERGSGEYVVRNSDGDYYLYTPGYSEDDYTDDARKYRKMAKGPAREWARERVKRDVQLVEDWLQDRWEFIGVIVKCDALGFDESLWGIESNSDYWKEVVIEMVEQALNN